MALELAGPKLQKNNCLMLGLLLKKRKPFHDRELLDDWLRIMEEVVEDVGIVYRSSFRLLETNNFKNESFLGLLRALYIMGLAEVDAFKRMRA